MEPENTGVKQAGRWNPGKSGNPAGRPKGARSKTTLAVEALLEGQAEALTQKAIEKALEGDGVALRLCLERIAPARKDAAVCFELPAITSAADTVSASSALLGAVAAGNVTPDEASRIMGLLTSHKALVEVCELERRIEALEARQ